jgi:hypothetical protein
MGCHIEREFDDGLIIAAERGGHRTDNEIRRVFRIIETTRHTTWVRGRCPRGVRLIGHAPQGHWKTITFVAGLRHRAIVACPYRKLKTADRDRESADTRSR